MIDDVPERRMEEIDSYPRRRPPYEEDSEAILDYLEEVRERAKAHERTSISERAINHEDTRCTARAKSGGSHQQE